MKYQNLCEQIIKSVGGKQNIEAVVHCMTRLRFTLKDRNLAKTDEIKSMSEVIDVVSNEVAYQIIIGTQVAQIHEELIELLGIEQSLEKKEHKNPIKAVLDLLSESMSPILEPILAAGLIAAILSIVSLTGLISVESSTYKLFETIRTSVFFFLPVLMAMSCAKRLHASPYLAVTLAVVLLSNNINGVEGLELFGYVLPTITYSNSFFPIILGVWFMGYVDKALSKVLPDALHYFLKPVFTLLICFPVTLVFFGPIGSWISEGMTVFFSFMTGTFGNWSAVMLYAALQPFLIMMGAGNFIVPIFMNFYATLGYDPVFTIAWVISDTAVCGAVVGYFFKTKDTKQRQLFATTAFSAFMGVTEPAVYGVLVKYRRPFIAIMIGGGLGGLYAGLMNVVGYAPVGLLGITSFIGDQNYMNFYNALIGVGIGFIGSMIASYLLGIPQEQDVVVPEVQRNLNASFTKSEVCTPIKGRVVVLSQINDKAFASGALGKGIAIAPEEEIVHSPVDGEVVALFPTKHAIGLKTEFGIEVLIHIGVDTVQLDPGYFESYVNIGDVVHKGDALIKADFEGIKKQGYDTTVIIVITNTSDYLDVVPTNEIMFSGKESCLTVIV